MNILAILGKAKKCILANEMPLKYGDILELVEEWLEFHFKRKVQETNHILSTFFITTIYNNKMISILEENVKLCYQKSRFLDI